MCYLHTLSTPPTSTLTFLMIFSAQGLIMLVGDLNATTGCVLDFVNTDCAHIPGVNLPQQHNVRRRNNYDPQVNDHGKSCTTRSLQNL